MESPEAQASVAALDRPLQSTGYGPALAADRTDVQHSAREVGLKKDDLDQINAGYEHFIQS